MIGTLTVLFGGPFTSPPVLAMLFVLLLTLIIGGVLLSLAWRAVLVVIAVLVALWLLGAVGLYPLEVLPDVSTPGPP